MVRLGYVFVDNILELDVDLLGIGVVRGQVLEGWVSELDVEGLVSRAVEAEGFEGDEGKQLLVYLHPRVKPRRLLLVGLGEQPGYEQVRKASATTALKAKELGAARAAVALPWEKLEGIKTGRGVEEAITAAVMALYSYDKYRSEKKEKPRSFVAALAPNILDGETAAEAVRRGETIGRAVNYARDLANTPPSDMNPEAFEEEAKRLAQELGLKLRVFKRRDFEELGMGGILGVGRGSSVEPRLLVLEYWGAGEGSKPVALIGKGVTFDAGGLQVKSHEAMSEMKYDKSGAAAVMGIVKGAAELGLKVNIVALIPLVENLPSSSSYKPGDVLRMYDGSTVEVSHTDAEGRLIMADALAYAAKEYDPQVITDLATLTGAIVVALGPHAIGLFSNNDTLAKTFEELSTTTGEKVWRMPLWPEYHEMLKSEIADVKSTGGRWGGAITAAAFLSRFVKDKPWVHLDIAGTAWTTPRMGARKPYNPPGATGVGVRLVLEYLREASGRGGEDR